LLETTQLISKTLKRQLATAERWPIGPSDEDWLPGRWEWNTHMMGPSVERHARETFGP